MSEEVGSIHFKADTTDLARAEAALSKLAEAGPKVEKSLDVIEKATSKTGKSLKTLGEGAGKGLDDIGKTAPKAAEGVGRVAKSADDAKKALAGIGSSASNLGQVSSAAAASARGMAGFSAALQSSQKTLFDLQAQVSAAAASVAQLGGAVATALPSMQAVVKAQSDAAKSALDMGGAFKSSADQMRAYSASSAGVADASAKTARSLDATATAARAFTTAMAVAGVGFGANELIAMVDGYTKFTAQLKLATKGASDYGVAMVSVKRIATDAQQGLGEVGTLYARIANGTAELGLNQRKLADITETVSLALKVSGATASESSSAMLQLSQAFASGVLRGEEFNSVNEAAPRLMKALADGINVPVGALRKMAEEGKLTSAVLSEALPKALGQLREEAKEVQTIGGAFTVLKNNIMEMVGAQSNASGTTKAFASGINALANNLDLLAAAGGAVAVVLGARFAASITASGVAFAASAVQAARYQAALASMAGVSTTAAAGLVTVGAAARGASAAMSLLGGPVGAVLTAVGLAATAFYTFGDSTSALAKSIGGLDQPLEDLKRKIDALPPEKRISIIMEIKDDAARKAKEAESSFDSLASSVVGAFSGARAASADSSRQVNELVGQLENAKKTGADMTPILMNAAKAASVPQSILKNWLDLAANIRAAREAAQAGNATFDGEAIKPPTADEIAKKALAQANSALDATKAFKSQAEQMAEVRKQGDSLRAALKALGDSSQGTGAKAQELRDRLVGVEERLKTMAKRGKEGASGINDALSAMVQGYKNADKAILDGRKDFYDQMATFAKLGTKSESDAIEASIAKEEEVWAKRQANFEAELAQAAKKKNSMSEVARITGAMQDAERDYLQNIAKLRADAAIADAKAEDALSERISKQLAANAATQLQIEAAQQEAKAVGLTGDALRAFNKERLESSIPLALRMQAAWAGEIGELGKLGDAARDQIQAFRELAKAQAEARAKQMVHDYTKGIEDGNRLLQAEISLMGQTERARETALEQLRIQLDLEKRIAAVKAAMEESPERTQMIADLEASAAIAKANAASRVFLNDWKESVKQYDEIFRKGFADMVNGGKSAWKSFTTSLVTTFKTSVADQIYKMFLQPFVVRIVGSLMGFVGGNASALEGVGGKGGASGAGGIGGGGNGIGGIFGGGSFTPGAAGLGGLAGSFNAGMAGGWVGFEGGISMMQGGQWAAGGMQALGAAAPYIGALIQIGQGKYGSGVGMAAGAYIGSIVPVIGTAIGALIGGIVGGLFDGGARGPNHSGGVASTATTDRDLAVKQVLGTDAWGNTLTDFTDRGNKDLDKQLDKTVKGMLDLYKSLAKIGGVKARDIDIAAGFSVNPKYGDEGAMGFFQLLDKQTGEVLKKYKNRDLDKDPQKAWAQFVADMGGELVNEIKKGDIPGWMREELDALDENVTLEGLNAAIQKIAIIDLAFKGWADSVTGFANLTAKAQTELLKFAGGIEALANGVNAFYAGFYSEQERAEILQRQVRDQLKKLDVDIDPAGGEEAKKKFRKLIEDALAAGNTELAAKLLALAQLFGVAADYAQKAAETAADAAKTAADEAARALEDAKQKAKDAALANFEAAVAREQEYWQRIVTDSQAAVQAISSILTPLKQSAKELFGSIDTAQQMQAAAGMVYIEQALASVRGGAKLSSFDGLSDAVTAARGGITSGRYASQFERDRDALVLANQLSQIAGYGDAQLSTEERQLKNSQEQLERLDKTLTYWRDLLEGNDKQIDATLSVEQAIKALEKLMFPDSPGGTGTGKDNGGAVLGGGGGGSAPGGSNTPPKYVTPHPDGSGGTFYNPITDPGRVAELDKLAGGYHAFDGTGDAAGLNQWIKDNNLSPKDLADLSGLYESDWDKWFKGSGLPSYDIGTNYVPRDMLAQIHEGEAIVPKAFNPWASGGATSGANSNARLEGLVAQLIDENRQQAGQIVRLNSQIARLLQRWDGDGMPQPRKEGEGIAA